MMRRLAALFAVVSLVGCSASEVIYVDSRFTADEVAKIEAGAAEWHRAAGVDIDLVFGADISNDTGRRILVRAANLGEVSDQVRETLLANPHATGSTVSDAGPLGTLSERIDIVVERMELGTDFLRTVTHEFGHHLGMHHIKDSSALMNDGPIGSSCVTHADAIAFCAELGCDAETIHFCTH